MTPTTTISPGVIQGVHIADNTIQESDLALGSVSPSRLRIPLGIGGTSTGPTFEGGNANSTFGVGVKGWASGAGSWAVHAEAAGSTGRALYARASSTTGASYAVYARNDSSTGHGLYVHSSSLTGSPTGVQILHDATFGNALQVETSALSGSAVGLSMQVRGSGSTGAYVKADGASASGVRVECAGAQSTGLVSQAGVYGVVGNASTTSGTGVQGTAIHDTGTGVRGLGISNSGANYGVVGETRSTSGFGVFSKGRFGATSNKGFVQPHPTDPTRQIFFVCLEGNENGTYFRGSGRIKGGRAEIPIPEAWTLVTEEKGITVQVTPLGRAQVWIVEKSRNRIVVGCDRKEEVEFDYFVNGVRRGFADFDPLERNRAFVPRERGVPFATGCPEGLRRILVRNGILNADGTPNEETARRLGWILSDPVESRGGAR